MDEDDEEFEDEETGSLSDGQLTRIERRNEISRRISEAMSVLGWQATRKDIAAMAGVTVATVRRYLGPSRAAPDPTETATTAVIRRAVRAAGRDRTERQGWHPDDQRLGLRSLSVLSRDGL